MTVEYTRPALISAQRVLFADNATLDAIILQALVNSVEASTEMIVDGEAYYTTKKSIDECMQACDGRAADVITDIMYTLKDQLLERLAAGTVKVNVTALKYCDVDGGLNDIDCHVSFKPAD